MSTPCISSLLSRLRSTAIGFIALSVTSLHAQTLTQRWATNFADINYSSVEGKLVKSTPDGHVVSASNSTNNSTFDDVIVIKSDGSTGTALWRRNSASPAGFSDSVSGLAIDGNGDIIVAGARTNSSYKPSFFAAKYSGTDGTQLWQRVFQTNLYDYFIGVAVDSKNDVIAVGNTRTNDGSPISSDIITFKFASSDGGTMWQNQFSTTGSSSTTTDAAKAMVLDASGNVYITGYGDNRGSLEALTLKLAANDGKVLWSQVRTDALTNGSSGEDIAVNAAGDVIVACSTNQGRAGFRVVKYRATDGGQLWVNLRKSVNEDFPNSLGIDPGGDVVVTGHTYAGTANDDILTQKISGMDGSTLWTRTYDGGITSSGLIKDDNGTAVRFDPAGNPVVAGYSNNLSGNGPDTMIFKYASKDGATLVQQRVAMSEGEDFPPTKDSLDVGPGHITVAGRFDFLGRNRMFVSRFNDPAGPSVVTRPPGAVGSATAQVGAAVRPNGSTTELRYVYGTTAANLDQSTAGKPVGNGYGTVESVDTFTDLKPSTTYFYQARATGSAQTVQGAIQQFTTSSNDASLKSLVASTGTMNPAFSPAVISYTITLPPVRAAMSVTPAVAHAAATLILNGAVLASGATSTPVDIAEGNTTFDTVVTAEDRTTTRTYSLTVTRVPEKFIFRGPGDVPVRAPGFVASGLSADLAIDFDPPTGTDLTMVDNTGAGFISGRFANLAHGQEVILSHGSARYRYIANYYGGDGNDLVLVWARQRLYGWGYNEAGQLGFGTTVNVPVPTAFPDSNPLSIKTVFSIATGYGHTLALCSDGSLYAWGSNDKGQLGNRTNTSSKVPIDITRFGALANRRVIAIAVGTLQSFALCSDGTLAGWGHNPWGILGDGTMTDRNVPTAVVFTGFLTGKKVVGVSSGQWFTHVLCSDGSIAGWGSNTQGVLGSGMASTTPVEVSRNGALKGKQVVTVAAGGDSFGMFRCTDGTAAGLGWNTMGQLGSGSGGAVWTPIGVLTSGVLSGKSLRQISPGNHHTVALTTDGIAVSWGENILGTLGNNNTVNSLVPVAVNAGGVLAGKSIISVNGGFFNSAALCSDGTVAVWGYGSYGSLGNGTTATSNVPVAAKPPAPGERFTSLSQGSSAAHYIAIAGVPLSDDSSLASLAISSGTLDPGFSPGVVRYDVSVPSGLATLTLTPVATNTYAAVSVNGKPVARASASPPIAILPGDNLIPIVVTAETGATTTYTITVHRPPLVASFGTSHAVAATVPEYSALGNTVELSLDFPPAPGTILTVINVTDPAFIDGEFANLAQGGHVVLNYAGVGYEFVANYFGGTGNDLVLQWAATRLATWGSNRYGQLGNAAIADGLVVSPADQSGVLAGRTVTAVSGGYLHSLALCSDGTLAAWGYNVYGQLGNGGTTGSGVPVAVDVTGALAGRTVIAIAAGSFHNLALCSDGTLVTWGYNNHGQLATGDTATRRIPVRVEFAGALAGKKVVGIAAGAYQGYAWCSDGTAVAWGFNDDGELGDGTQTTTSMPVAVDASGALAGRRITCISAGQYHALALCSDGTLATWGYNDHGQLGNQTLLGQHSPVAIDGIGALEGNTIVRISGGGSHSLALSEGGMLFGWGLNASGQLGVTTAAEIRSPIVIPVPPGLGRRPVGIAAGNVHSVAWLADDGIAAWGGNSHGQLGDGGITDRPTAELVDDTALDPDARFMFAASGSSASHDLAVAGIPHTTILPLAAHAASAVDPAVVDGDQDGIPDLVEYAFGLDRLKSSTATLPQPRWEAGQTLIRFATPAGVEGIVYGAEWSATLRPDDWTAIPDTGDKDEHVFIIPNSPRVFIRLKVASE